MSTIIWFRKDLRIQDNPALEYAAKNGPIIAIYIIDEAEYIGSAQKWWLHHSLQSLKASLAEYNHELKFFKGKPIDILKEIIQLTKANNVAWNRCYEPYNMQRDAEIKTALIAEKINVKSFNSHLLFKPWEIKNKQNSFFKVYTPFWKHCLQSEVAQQTDSLNALKNSTAGNFALTSLPLHELNLLPKTNWIQGFEENWRPGETAALKKFETFIKNGITNYTEKRDCLDQPNTSLLSPHLHFGEISPHKIFHDMQKISAQNRAKFLSELGWREFSYHLLYHIPTLPTKSVKPEFAAFPWEQNETHLKAWQKGKTGIPIIDAAMRELWHTGYMHNRARMIVASFLTKNLLIPWQEGAAWFMNTLLDADLANNSASWQWIAGCGFDAAPYFRIFNPTIQAQKFDPTGAYIKKWLPELSNLPLEYTYEPWKTTSTNYTPPIVDLKESRERALKAYEKIKYLKNTNDA